MVLGIILEKKNGGPGAWTRGPLAGLRFTVHSGPRTGTVAGARRSVAHRRSRALDLAVTAWEASGGDGDLYPDRREMAEGLGRPGWRWTEVVARVPRREGARGAEVRKRGEQRVWCGQAETGVHFIGWGGGGEEGRRSAKRRLEVCYQGAD
jgi:hypothetical protein